MPGMCAVDAGYINSDKSLARGHGSKLRKEGSLKILDGNITVTG